MLLCKGCTFCNYVDKFADFLMILHFLYSLTFLVSMYLVGCNNKFQIVLPFLSKIATYQ